MNLNLMFGVILCFSVVILSMMHQSESVFFESSRISQVMAHGNGVFVTWVESTENDVSILFRKSSDAGHSFGKTVEITNDAGVAASNLMAISGNNVYFVWGSESDKLPQILFRKSSDGGNTFDPIMSLSASGKVCSEPYDLLAAGSNVYVFFNCYERTTSEGSIIFMTSRDYGETFEEPITIFQGKNIYANVAVSAAADEKNVFVAFQNDYNISSNPSDIIFKSSHDGGETFGNSTVLSDGKYWYANPNIAMHGNSVYATWVGYDRNDFKYLIFKKSDDGGKTFENSITLRETKSGDYIGTIPTISVADNGQIYVNWGEIQLPPNASKQIRTIYYKTSTDAGNSFGEINSIFENPDAILDPAHSAIQPEIDQNIYVMWPEATNEAFHTTGIFFKKSIDGGKTFGDAVDLNNKNYFSHQMYNPHLATFDSYVYVVGDSADNGHEIFFIASPDGGNHFGKITDLNDHNIPKQKTPSPVAQLKSGVSPQNIECKDGFVLLLRDNGDRPACVRPASLAKFLTSGWKFGIDDKAESAIKDATQVITFGEKIPNSGGLVPITITQITKKTKPIDSVTDWNFLPLGQNGDNIHRTWDSLPNSYSKSEIVDQNNNEIMDWSKISQPIVTTLEMIIYSVMCDSDNRIVAEAGHPVTYPIKKGNTFAAIKNTGRGLLPDSDGKYSMEYTSFFETKFEFPKGATVILNETKSCVLESKVDDYSKVFYNKISFKID